MTAPSIGKAAPAARARLPVSPLLRASSPDEGQPRSLLRRWSVTVAVSSAIIMTALAVSERWFDVHGYFRPVYAIHDVIVLPVAGWLWTAWFPWGLLYLIPGVTILALTAAGFLSGRRPLRGLQRRMILAAARRDFGPDILCRAHRWQRRRGLPGRFMRSVIANAADDAVNTVLLGESDTGGTPGLARNPDHAGLAHAGLALAWRLAAMRSEMTAEAKPGARARHAAAAQVALLWLVAPPADGRIGSRIRAAWRRLWPAAAPRPDDDGAPDGPGRLARWLRKELTAIESGIHAIEHRGGRYDPAGDTASPRGSLGPSTDFWLYSWEHYAERIIAAMFLAGIAPDHAFLTMRVIDAVERVALADLVSPQDGAGGAAEAVSQALEITDARRAASLIGARIDRSAAGDLMSWREPGGAGPGPRDLAPALRGLAEAAADPRADGPAEQRP